MKISVFIELFQFEASDLDFGIYRIPNCKRDQIDKFIKEEIKKIVENAFSKHKDERLLNITQKFGDARKRGVAYAAELAREKVWKINA
jgi:adenine-specific DNA-methyltransferase